MTARQDPDCLPPEQPGGGSLDILVHLGVEFYFLYREKLLSTNLRRDLLFYTRIVVKERVVMEERDLNLDGNPLLGADRCITYCGKMPEKKEMEKANRLLHHTKIRVSLLRNNYDGT